MIASDRGASEFTVTVTSAASLRVAYSQVPCIYAAAEVTTHTVEGHPPTKQVGGEGIPDAVAHTPGAMAPRCRQTRSRVCLTKGAAQARDAAATYAPSPCALAASAV